jgi:membrane-associated phospholipid phosphatase
MPKSIYSISRTSQPPQGGALNNCSSEECFYWNCIRPPLGGGREAERVYLLKKLFLIILFLPQTLLFSQNPDIRILRSINSPKSLPADNFFKFVSNSDAFIIAGAPAIMGAVALINHNKNLFRNAEVLVGATAVNFGITTILKYTVNRQRPFVTYPDIMKKSKAGSPSFPSGHTSGAFVTATSISLSYPKWYVIAPLYLWAGTVGYSRMDLGVHYPSDVLAGALIGSGSAWLTWYVNKKLVGRKH